MLIVLDDVRDAAQIRPLLPGTPGCAVLATSRSRLTGLPGARLLELGAFDPDEALALFRAVAGPDRVAGSRRPRCGARSRCAGICRWRCGSWPRGWPPGRTGPPRRWPGGCATRPGGWTSCGPATWPWRRRSGSGYEQLRPEQAHAFRLLAVPDGPDIGVEAVAALLCCSEQEAEELAEELVDLCLVESPSPGRYRLHALLRMFARRLAAEIDGPAAPRAALDRLIRHYLGVAPRRRRW